jgi:hypothetical protein
MDVSCQLIVEGNSLLCWCPLVCTVHERGATGPGMALHLLLSCNTCSASVLHEGSQQL